MCASLRVRVRRHTSVSIYLDSVHVSAAAMTFTPCAAVMETLSRTEKESDI